MVEIGGVPGFQKVALIAEGRSDEIHERPVFNKHRIEEQERFEDHLQTGGVVLIQAEKSRFPGVRSGREDVFELHPLGGESVQEAFNLGVGKHPLDGPIEDFVDGQFSTLCCA